MRLRCEYHSYKRAESQLDCFVPFDFAQGPRNDSCGALISGCIEGGICNSAYMVMG